MSKILSGILVFVLSLGVAQSFAGTKVNDETIIITQSSVLDAGGFPFKITQPGNYKLAGNLVVPADTSAIQIRSNDVTLDLNGFSITGGIVCDVQGSNCNTPTVPTVGIEAILGQVNGQLSNIFGVTIRNGHVRGFNTGISTFGGIVEEITAQGNFQAGISASDAVVRRNDASRNHGAGITCGNCTVRDNVAVLNQGNGFELVFGGVFAGNTAVAHQNELGALLGLGVISDNNNSCNSSRC